MMTVFNTDVYLDGEMYLAFDNAMHATAFAAGFNAGLEAKARFFTQDLRKLRQEIANQSLYLNRLGVTAPWHSGFAAGLERV